MKKQLLALALVAGIGAATWSAEGHAIEPTGHIDYAVARILDNPFWAVFGPYKGMRYGAGGYACQSVAFFQSYCAEIGDSVGAF